MSEIRRTVASSKHYRIIEKIIPNKIPMQKYYSIIYMDDDGREIGWNKAFTLEEAFDLCFAEIHLRATHKPYVFRKNRNHGR